MSFKVAVASTNGLEINEHFGRAKHFLIFELVDGHFKLAEVREITSPHCGGIQHDNAAINHIADLLGDCRLVLTSQIGPGAIAALRTKGIHAFAVPELIDSALDKLVSSYEVKNYVKKNAIEN